jgi:hypothetical protein
LSRGVAGPASASSSSNQPPVEPPLATPLNTFADPLGSRGPFVSPRAEILSLTAAEASHMSLEPLAECSLPDQSRLEYHPDGLSDFCQENNVIRHNRETVLSEDKSTIQDYQSALASESLDPLSNTMEPLHHLSMAERLPLACCLPTEIIQQIYSYLAPQDFNAARHCSQIWMKASLHTRLLKMMLKRGGWWSGVNAFAERRMARVPESSDETDQWLLSMMLARECALTAVHQKTPFEIPCARSRKHLSNGTAVEVCAVTDFSDMASGDPGPARRHSGGLLFTASTCGKFILASEGGTIYVYSISGKEISLFTSVICPRRVLAVSMDSSARRYAVAALLDGRMGMVCDLLVSSPFEPTQSSSSSQSYKMGQNTGLDAFIMERNKRAGCVQSSIAALQPGPSRSPPVNAIDVLDDANHLNVRNVRDEQSFDSNLVNRTWNIRLRGSTRGEDAGKSPKGLAITKGVLVEDGPHTIYRHLCSEDDPPRSVSICPQRRCVAFGCSAGIELHWVDALTCQDLSRWFPLTATSDFLYFLPPRIGIDSAKKLRLVSSAAHPEERPAIYDRFYSTRPTAKVFWSIFSSSGIKSLLQPESSRCDHYYAVPLSDGHHILFTDPCTGALSLGCDAPVGHPNKLLRKIMFVPPKEGDIPRIYAAAADLTWGPRVIAGFGDRLVLYCVPHDVFLLSELEQRVSVMSEMTARRMQSALVADASEADPAHSSSDIKAVRAKYKSTYESVINWLQWADGQLAGNSSRIPPDSFDGDECPLWPLHIQGVEIGKLEGLVELSIDSAHHLTIWAFSIDGLAVTWQLKLNKRSLSVEERVVSFDGAVQARRNVNVDGSVISAYTRGEDGAADIRSGKDDRPGTVRVPRALRVENDIQLDALLPLPQES